MQTLSTRIYNRIPIILITIFLNSLQAGYGQEVARNKYQSIDTLSIRQAAIADGDYRSTMPNYIPVSPTAGSLITFADYPVSYYSGVPNVSIPLYEIEIDNYKLPISLSYHASGIKLSQEASWVGLGWALNTGGIISRTIKCYDDFLEYPQPAGSVKYGYYNGPEADNPHASEYYTTTGNGAFLTSRLVIDSEPDIFSYSLPETSGKFVIDKSRGAVLFDKSINIKIELFSRNQKKHFKITAPDGTQYLFEDYETTYAYSRQGSLNRNLSNASKFDESDLNIYDSPLIYTSSWYLTQITTTNNRTIHFAYTNESYKSPTQESCVRYNQISQSGNSICGPGNNLVYSCNKTVIENLRLSKISWDGGFVEFNCSSREDMIGNNLSLSPQKLSTLKVYDKNNLCIKAYEFDYDYFNNNYAGSYKQAFKRLKIKGLKNLLSTNENYEFIYNEGSLPAKNSKNTDYWGYYNGTSQESEYYCTAQYGDKIYKGADKTSRLNYMKTGSLQGIKYPTGELTRFTYETNNYMPSTATSTTIQKVTEGISVYQYYSDDVYAHLPNYKTDTLVISRNTSFLVQGYADNMSCKKDPDIRYNDAENYPSFKISKLHSSGNKNLLFSYPVPAELEYDACSFDFEKKELYLTSGTYIIEAIGQAKDVLFGFTYQYEKTITTTNKETSAGGLRIAKIEAGKNVRNFKYSIGELLIEPVVYYLSSHTCFNGTSYLDRTSYLVQVSESVIPMWTFKQGNSIGYSSVTESVSGLGKTVYNYYNTKEENEYDYPFFPTQINYYNGLIQSVKTYKGESLVKLVRHEYSNKNSQPVYGFMFNAGGGDSYSYQYRIEWPFKSKETIIDYESNGNITTEKEYTYNNDMLLKTESINICGDHYRKEITYPSDENDAVSQTMASKHMINTPVETIALKNGMVIKGKKTIYKDTLNMIVPKEEYTLETQVPLFKDNYKKHYFPQLAFNNYNTWGKPMQISDKKTAIVYLWSYNGMYPVAEIKNSTYQEIAQILTAEFIRRLGDKSMPTANDMEQINGLRKTLPNALITTFTYLPLIGVSTITDPRNFTTYYIYDSSSKLKENYILKNGSKQILEQYDYHYRNK